MYATVSELVNQYGVTEITQLLDDEEGNVTAAVLTAVLNDEDTSAYTAEEVAATVRGISRADGIIAQCGNIIDASIGRHYPVPLTDTQARATAVHTCCLSLARAMLADDGDNLSDSMAKDRERWMIWLRDVSTQKAILPGISPVATNSGNRSQRLTAKPASITDNYISGGLL